MRHAGRAGELGAHVPPHEVDEVRLIGSWLASHPEAPQLALRQEPSGGEAGGVPGLSARTAARRRRPEPVVADVHA